MCYVTNINKHHHGLPNKLVTINSKFPFSCLQMSAEPVQKVSSEIYSEYDYTTSEPPRVNKNNVVSKFKFHFPHDSAKLDQDGDLLVCRKQEDTNNLEIFIEHSKSTELGLVGLQIWRGALLLADWLLYDHENIPENSLLLELGSGVGLTSIVGSLFAPVICTDIKKREILKLIKGNVKRNADLLRHPIKVYELDFTKQILHPEIAAVLPDIKTIIAADVVYDDKITEAFVWTVGHLLSKPPKRTIYVALEKRYVFTVANCDIEAPCYAHFLKCIKKLPNVTMEEVALDFPQYFQYERIKELVLWKITSNSE